MAKVNICCYLFMRTRLFFRWRLGRGWLGRLHLQRLLLQLLLLCDQHPLLLQRCCGLCGKLCRRQDLGLHGGLSRHGCSLGDLLGLGLLLEGLEGGLDINGLGNSLRILTCVVKRRNGVCLYKQSFEGKYNIGNDSIIKRRN